jgi:phosphoenolpyruvate carboxykinase (GTP)
MPLVIQAPDWERGVYVAATIGSETTAAAAGTVGLVRRDPMAMLPFCGYHMGDYFKHWLKIGSELEHPPAIFGVNWFRKNSNGKFMWPGYGQNMRVLKWIVERVNGKAGATDGFLGFVPRYEDLDWSGMSDFNAKNFSELMKFDHEAWQIELKSHSDFFKQLGAKLPEEFSRIRQTAFDHMENGDC